jgi:hypothetical protein
MRSDQPINGEKGKRTMRHNGSNGKSQKRTALLVRCSADEAAAIRAAAMRERRTLSGFILNTVANRVHRYQLAASHLSRHKANGHSQPEAA